MRLNPITESERSIRANQYRIEDLEFRRLRDLSNVLMQTELLALLTEQQAQLNKLTALRNEQDFLVLLMCLRFKRLTNI